MFQVQETDKTKLEKDVAECSNHDKLQSQPVSGADNLSEPLDGRFIFSLSQAKSSVVGETIASTAYKHCKEMSQNFERGVRGKC